MDIDSILEPNRTVCSLEASSKKKAIELVAKHIAECIPDLDVAKVYRGLLDRERLGSTALGKGVAIPHCRLSDTSAIIGGLFRLSSPLEFDAPDDQPVKFMFVLLVPEAETTEHLAVLAKLAERFDRDDYRDSLTSAGSDFDLYTAAIRES